MSMSISSISGQMSAMMYSGVNSQNRLAQGRPDAGRMVENLFSKLDTENKGYLEKSDLVNAFGSLGTTTDKTSGVSADEVFETLDADADGKLTQSEMTSSLNRLAEALDNQFNSMRMSGTEAMGGMPPPPPPAGEHQDNGLTQEEMTNIAATTSDTNLANLLNSVASDFETADADGDGRVTRDEAMAFQAGTNETSSSGNVDETTVLRRVMDLMRAYAAGTDDSASSSLISLTA